MSFSHQIVQDRDHGREVFHIDKYYLYYFNMKQSDVTRISILYASIYNLIASSHKKTLPSIQQVTITINY